MRRNRNPYAHPLVLALAAGTMLAANGCSKGTSADRAAFLTYYDATATPLRAYVSADTTLSQEQKNRRTTAIDAAGSYAESIRAK